MKRIAVVLALIFLFGLLPTTVCASNVGTYDFRDDEIQSSDDFDAVEKMESAMLQDLGAVSEMTSRSTPMEIDFSNAVKVLSYTPQEIISVLESETLIASIEQHSEYCWKIPVAYSSDGVDYAVAYQNADGDWSYYTASTTQAGISQVQYLFNPNLVTECLSELDSVDSVFALTVSEINIDLLVAASGDEIVFIPFASRPDLLTIENGKKYNAAEIRELIQTYVMTEKSAWEATGGGAGTTDKNNIHIFGVVLVILLGGVCMFGILKKRMR